MKFIVYCIHNLTRDHYYIGSSVQFEVRSKEHAYLLRCNKHHNPRLQRAWNKYGESSFSIQILEETEADDVVLRAQEQKWMDTLKSVGLTLYNLCPTTTRTTLGVKFGPRTAEVKQKIRLATLGKKRSAETKQKLSDLMLGNILHAMPHTEEAKRLMGDKKRGKIWVTDGVISRLIHKNELEQFVSAGFYRGFSRHKKLTS
jgi:group I intron endonuclease